MVKNRSASLHPKQKLFKLETVENPTSLTRASEGTLVKAEKTVGKKPVMTVIN